MSASNRIVRITLIVLLTILFSFAAFYLYSKQKEKYTFSSFRIEQELAGVMIPNIDRLCDKITKTDELTLINLPADLNAGIQFLIDKKNFLFTEEISQGCFISYNATDFSIAFETSEMDAFSVSELLKTNFEIESVPNEKALDLNGKKYLVETFNQFLVVSTIAISPVKKKIVEQYGNADFILFSNEYTQGSRHIIANDYHHQVWEDSLSGPLGQPLYHSSFLNYIPASFQEIYFYGSSRMETDNLLLFNQPNENSFAWVDGGITIVKKDSFAIMIAPQNLEQDLRLSIEEQTLVNKSDTIQIPYFNIGPFEIMSFKTSFNWSSSIPEITDEFNYFTSLENFNIVANSIPAMRWYLGELQLGNLFFKNSQIKSVYENAIPQRSHSMSMKKNSEGVFILSSKIWRSSEICVITSTQLNANAGVSESVQLIADFDVEIIPTSIQKINKADSVFVLLTNLNQVMLYDTIGNKKWALNLSTSLIDKTQIIDLENDGNNEIVIFQSNQIDIVNTNGKSVSGFPKKYEGFSKGGLAVNYDESYNYRFFVSIGNQVKCFDESGNLVQGWLFSGMTAELNGPIFYYSAQGKDLIAFKDMNNKQFILNRKGESRLTKEITVRLPNETSFPVGNYEASSLRKMGYKNNYIYNYYTLDGLKDSIKLDKDVLAINVSWIFNENHPLLVIEETERIVIFDEFGYEKGAVLKPDATSVFIVAIVKQDFNYVFADNSQNTLYLLNGYGKMVFPVPVKGSNVFLLNQDLLYTFVGTKIKIYKID